MLHCKCCWYFHLQGGLSVSIHLSCSSICVRAPTVIWKTLPMLCHPPFITDSSFQNILVWETILSCRSIFLSGDVKWTLYCTEITDNTKSSNIARCVSEKEDRVLGPVVTKWTVPREHFTITTTISYGILSLCFNGIQSTTAEEEPFSPFTAPVYI